MTKGLRAIMILSHIKQPNVKKLDIYIQVNCVQLKIKLKG